MADTMRIASFNMEMQRDGPGLLLRDILRGEDPQIAAAVTVIVHAAPDVIVVQGFDYDLDGAALAAFAQRVADAGHALPHRFAARPNTGMQTDLDLDGDGLTRGPRDAQGYGRFSGEGGIAVLSRFPIEAAAVRDYSSFLWRDLPDALQVTIDGAPFPSAEAEEIQRLSTTAHWIVPVTLPEGPPLHLLAFHATPPVFDGPEDRNGRRNHDEIMFWSHLLDGVFDPPPTERFVIVGDANNDPEDGEGLKQAITGLLSRPDVQDVRAQSAGSLAATGDPFDTVDWDDPVPGNLRVSYVLPSADLQVIASGVLWPAKDNPLSETIAAASRHRLVWVDIAY